MKLVKATPENIDVGSVLQKDGEVYFVYKVNKTFVWAGKHDSGDVISSWKDKSIKEKWVDLMERVKGKKLNYTNLEVEESGIEKIAAKKKIEDSFKTPSGKKNKRYLKRCCEKEMDKLFAAFKKSREFRYPVECICGKRFHAINCSPDGMLLINHDYTMFFFDARTREYNFFRKVGEGKKKKEEVVKPEEEKIAS